MRLRAALSIAGAALLLFACAATPEVGAEGGIEARRALAEAAARGPVLASIEGMAAGLDQSERDRLVTEAMAHGVAGLGVSFTTDPARAAAETPRLVVLLNAAPMASTSRACRQPAALSGDAAQAGRLNVLAAFCRDGEALGSARGELDTPLADPRQLERLLWSTAGALFPDDYGDTYGFDILPGWLGLGLEGSFGF